MRFHADHQVRALNLGIAGSSLSHDPGVVARYEEDPAIVRRVSARWGGEILKALAALVDRAQEIEVPMLIVHGGADPVADASGSRWLHDNVSGEAELIVYEGAFHEPHNDLEYADVATDVARWVASRDARLAR